MANDEASAMHPDFPRWYRDVSVDENRDRLQRRWAGVAALVRDIAGDDCETALRLVFRAKSPASADGLARIRQIFKSADDLFDMEGNDREVEVLCGAYLAALIERKDNVAASGALAIAAASFDGARAAQLPMDLPSLAETAIGRLAESNRQRPDLQPGSDTFPTISFAGAKTKLQTFDQNGVGAAFDVAGAAVAAGFESLGNYIEASAERIGKYIAIQDEELEMLWWVFGERSEDLNKPFKDVAAKAQPLVFAKELADATNFLPGPISARGILSRAGLKESKKVTVPEAVNACEVSWLTSILPSDAASPLTRPIHFAIARKLETNDDTSWVAGWANSCGIDEKYSLSALALGNLFYRERLLSRFSME